MSNFEKLSQDSDFLAMFRDPRFEKRLEIEQGALIENKDLDEKDRTWKQGFLAGVKYVQQYPASQVRIQEAIEEHQEMTPDPRSRLAAAKRMMRTPLRFMGGG